MKKRIIILLIIFLLSTTTTIDAQSEKTNETTDNSVVTNISEKLGADFSERFITTSVIIAEVLILFAVLFYWKKTRKDGKIDDNKIYRNNIKAIRDERVIPIVNVKKSKRRKKLNTKFKINSLNGKMITAKAKKLSISKGELFLAARIQQLKNQVR